VITPYILAVALLIVMLVWRANPYSSRAVPLILLWDMACLVGVIVWARSTRDYWPMWALVPTWALWFVIGVGAIVWTLLAMRMVQEDEPPPPAQPESHERNYVAPTVYGSRARTPYVFKGTKRKGKRR